MNDTRVLFTTLSMRTSAKGNDYCVGWLGACELVGFPGEADRFGNADLEAVHQGAGRASAA